MIKPNLDEVNARHDQVVLVGKKLASESLSEDDLLTLFDCCADVPSMLAYIEVLENRLLEAESVIVRASDSLTTDHPVWLVLDDYDGSMDSVKALAKLVDAAIAARDGLQPDGAEVSELMGALDRWAWAGAVETLARWKIGDRA